MMHESDKKYACDDESLTGFETPGQSSKIGNSGTARVHVPLNK